MTEDEKKDVKTIAVAYEAYCEFAGTREYSRFISYASLLLRAQERLGVEVVPSGTLRNRIDLARILEKGAA